MKKLEKKVVKKAKKKAGKFWLESLAAETATFSGVVN